jgi:hypothetical protein
MYYFNICIVILMSNSNNRINIDNEINWEEVVKKEARGIDNADFGEVQEIVYHYILTEKGIINKEKFYLPTELVEGFDGDKLRFNILEEDANEKFRRDTPPSAQEYAIYKKKEINADANVSKQDNNKTITNSLESNFSPSKEKEPVGEVKSKQEQKNTDSTIQDKNYILRDKSKDKQENELVDKEIEDKARVEAEEAMRLESERKAQSISQQIQDKAKMEAERKAQAIIQQAEDKARVEAERRSKEITKEIEDKARVEAEERAKRKADERSKEIQEEVEQRVRRESERKAQAIIQQAEYKARVEAEDKRAQNQEITKIMDYYPHEKGMITPIISYNVNNKLINPFTAGINLWQNYSQMWMDLYKQTMNNTSMMTKDFANTVSKSWLINNWFTGYKLNEK